MNWKKKSQKSDPNRCEIWKQVGPSKEKSERDLRGRNKKGGSDTNKAGKRKNKRHRNRTQVRVLSANKAQLANLREKS